MNGIPHTIAVLPFVNRSADAAHEYFSDGITEEIINALAQISGLKVISRTSSFYFKGKALPLTEIAKQLNAPTILEGSVRTAGQRVRITAQLIAAEEDVHYWAETWDRQLEDIFAVQDEISLLIAERLREQLGHFEIGEHLVVAKTESVDAYQLDLKAKYLCNQWNPEDVQQAIGCWEEAVLLDPRHVDAYVGLADAYGFMATTAFMPREEAWQKTAAFTHKAFTLDPTHVGVLYQLANLKFFTECDFAGAMAHALEAVAQRPQYPDAQQFLAFLYLISGQQEKAQAHLKMVLGIDPLNYETRFYKALHLYRTHQYAQALEVLNECLAHNDKNIPAYVVKAYTLIMLGAYGEALDFLDATPESIVIPDEVLGLRCLAHLRAGNAEEWATLLPQLVAAAEGPMAFQAHTYLFLAYATQGMHDEAFAWLEKALGMHSSILQLAFSDPLVGGLVNDARYAVFHKRLYPIAHGAPVQSGKKGVAMADAEAQQYARQLTALMEQEEPFLNPALTLRVLAAQLTLTANQLSWLLNERFGVNFNSFVNSYRVDRFKQLAQDPANSHISLIGLAYESGFNSKTVFNTYFKKAEGSTPKAWLTAQQQA